MENKIVKELETNKDIQNYNFFAMMSRMKYIERWALMRNTRAENISEHCLEVSMIAHGLAVIANKRFGKDINVEKTALIGLYHDAPEIITGDMPTPVKYYNSEIKGAYKEVEEVACKRILSMLPDDLRDEYTSLFFKKEGEEYLWKLVKAADKISAYIKCIEELNSGNGEFKSAKKTLEESIEKMKYEVEEIGVFMEEFLPPFGKTLDELQMI